jgi:hypothetical protein
MRSQFATLALRRLSRRACSASLLDPPGEAGNMPENAWQISVEKSATSICIAQF